MRAGLTRNDVTVLLDHYTHFDLCESDDGFARLPAGAGVWRSPTGGSTVRLWV